MKFVCLHKFYDIFLVDVKIVIGYQKSIRTNILTPILTPMFVSLCAEITDFKRFDILK